MSVYNNVFLVHKYTKGVVDPDILKEYKPGEDFIVYNKNDNDLTPIKVYIPKTPLDITKIDGYGLPASEQMFNRFKMPERLKDLPDIIYNSFTNKTDRDRGVSIKHMWDYIKDNKDSFQEELLFMKKMWHYRLYGYTFFNNGVPTQITGTHFLYLNAWHLDDGLPKYIDRDRMFFWFKWFCKTDTTTFTRFETKKGVRVGAPEDNGEYIMRDTGKRVCFGFNYPKHRREGATYKSQASGFDEVSIGHNLRAGTTSMTGQKASDTFSIHTVNPLKKMWFFFKPYSQSGDDPKNEIIFSPSGISSKSGGGAAVVDTGLGSIIDYSTTSAATFYDSIKLAFWHDDEVGKTVEYPVDHRHSVFKQCLVVDGGSNIIGLNIKTSTVGEMEKRGGAAFFNIINDSHWEIRDEVLGQTPSGNYNLFIPASFGMIVDKHGNSDVELAEKTLKSKYEYYEAQGTTEAMEQLNELKRLYPLVFRDCFRKSSTKTGFDQVVLNNVSLELRLNPKTIKGNFEWVGGVKFGRVYFDVCENGRWELSFIPKVEDTNQFFVVDGIKRPKNHRKFITSSDAFKFAHNKNGSKGALSTFMRRDIAIDGDNKDVSMWKTHRFVSDYLYRHSIDELFCEDALKECIYWGSMLFPEHNIDIVENYFIKHNFGGYLLYQTNPDGTNFDYPGFFTSNNIKGSLKEKLFGLVKNYISLHGKKEKHNRIIDQWSEIEGIDDMNSYDLFTSSSGCLLGDSVMGGIDSPYVPGETSEEQTDLGGVYDDFIDLIES